MKPLPTLVTLALALGAATASADGSRYGVSLAFLDNDHGIVVECVIDDRSGLARDCRASVGGSGHYVYCTDALDADCGAAMAEVYDATGESPAGDDVYLESVEGDTLTCELDGEGWLFSSCQVQMQTRPRPVRCGGGRGTNLSRCMARPPEHSRHAIS